MVPAPSSVPVPVAGPPSRGPMDSCRSMPSGQARPRSPPVGDPRRLSVHSAGAGAGAPASTMVPSVARTQADAQTEAAAASSGSGGGGPRPASAGADGESMEHRLTLDFLEENGYFDMPIQVGASVAKGHLRRLASWGDPWCRPPLDGCVRSGTGRQAGPPAPAHTLARLTLGPCCASSTNNPTPPPPRRPRAPGGPSTGPPQLPPPSLPLPCPCSKQRRSCAWA